MGILKQKDRGTGKNIKGEGETMETFGQNERDGVWGEKIKLG